MRISTEDELRAVLHESPAPDLRGRAVGEVMRRGRRRRLARRGATASALVALLVVGVAGAGALTGGQHRSAVPASGHEQQLEAWTTCLNSQEVPGVLAVVVPGNHGPEVQFLGDRPALQVGQPAPRPTLSDDDVRRIAANVWQSALEHCTAAEPGLVDEVQARWGDVTTVPAANKRWMASVDQYNADYHACLRAHGVVTPTAPPTDAPIEDQQAYADQRVVMFKQGVKAGCPYNPPPAPNQ